MKYIKQLPALFILLLTTACASSDEENTTTPLTTTPADTTSKQTVQQTTAPATTTVALNPAHGMPGHRCDIKVGEPLNSKPSPAIINPPQQQAPIINPAPASSTSANGAKNPAHGMPGHRCDIAVGAPLNSKPTQ